MGRPSQASRPQELAVRPLVARGRFETLLATRERVLLHDQPTAVAACPQRGEHAVGIQVTLSKRRKGAPFPDFVRRAAVGDDRGYHVSVSVLEMYVVDAIAPVVHRGHRIAAA